MGMLRKTEYNGPCQVGKARPFNKIIGHFNIMGIISSCADLNIKKKDAEKNGEKKGNIENKVKVLRHPLIQFFTKNSGC